MKRWIRNIHLWIGLPLGGLFFIISLSGALFCWEPEIAAIIYKEKVTPQISPFIAVTSLRKNIKNALPKGDFRTISYRGPARAIQVLLYAPGTYYHANFNPYTGDLVHLQNMNKGWLNQVKHLHRNLLMGDIGREIVHWGTLFYLIMVISGLVLWWPSNRIMLRKRLKIHLKAPTKVFNYEFHNVIGFYSSFILLFVIMSGLFWGFSAVENSFRRLSGEDLKTYDTPASVISSTKQNTNKFQLMDVLATRFIEKFPNKTIRISNPHKKHDPIQVSIIENNQLVPHVDRLYFDRYTGKQLKGYFKYGLHEERSFFNKLETTVYDVHFGSILGFTGRLLVFIASLIAASLPLTGFFIWWNKKRS